MIVADDIRQAALRLGFDAVGVTDAAPVDVEQVEYLGKWLADGCAGAMAYLERNLEKRVDPRKLLEGARSVIVVELNYKPGEKENNHKETATGRVAEYARYEDYHDFIKKRLRELAQWMVESAGTEHRFKICVDSVPLAERALAERAGLGFVGRNHMLIHPVLGPQIFLGEIVTTVEIAGTVSQSPRRDKHPCGDCRKCIDACPTGALSEDGRFDARRCISYLTIEHKGEIEPELAKRMVDRLFGCDNCVLACPYRERAPVRRNRDLQYHAERERLVLQDVLEMDEDRFRERFAGSVLFRCGLKGLQRNARICLENLERGKVR